MSLYDLFKDELDTIKKAPRTFTVGFIVLAILIGVGEYSFFKEMLSSKDDVIGTLKQELETSKIKPPQNSASNCVNQAPLRTGPATATGTGVVANTGNSSTINNGTPSSEGKGKTPSH